MTTHRRAYYKVYKAAIYARNRAVLDELKKQPCKDCGQAYPPYVMEFDHRNPAEKKYSVGNGLGPKAFEIELAKCDVVCGNCHNIRTHFQRMAGKL